MLKEEVLKLNTYKFRNICIAVIILEKIKMMFHNILSFLLHSIYFMFEKS